MLVKAMGREPTSEPLRRVQLQRKRLFLSPKKECGPNYRAEADHANARTLIMQWSDIYQSEHEKRSHEGLVRDRELTGKI